MDCASIYENEGIVGDALEPWIDSHGRDSVFVTSKIWNDSHQPDAVRYTLSNFLIAVLMPPLCGSTNLSTSSHATDRKYIMDDGVVKC